MNAPPSSAVALQPGGLDRMNATIALCPSPPRGNHRINDLSKDFGKQWVDCTCCGTARVHEHDKCRTCNGWGVLVVGELRL